MNVILVSHCSFQGNSALHVYNIASELYRVGHSPIISVPTEPETVSLLGKPPFPVCSYDDAAQGERRFPNGGSAELIHAFTPREQVRTQVVSLVAHYRCPYVIHLEDNEEAIVDEEIADLSYKELGRLPPVIVERLLPPWRTYPHRAPAFLSGAAGVTALIDRLLEFKPDAVPGTVFWPGFDESFLQEPASSSALRRDLGLSESDLVLVYTGDVHHSNLVEVRSLFLAVGLLRRAGYPVTLLKTGWNRVDMGWVAAYGLTDWVRELGYLPRAQIPELVHAADVLVQPGRSNRFNDYRFPSKLPEFLASGRPVLLPRTNIGRYLRDGEEALLLDRGDAIEICEKVSMLADSPRLRERLGAGGRKFAVSRLSWANNVRRIADLYKWVHSEKRRSEAQRHAASGNRGTSGVPRPKLIVFLTSGDHGGVRNDAPSQPARSDGKGLFPTRESPCCRISSRLNGDARSHLHGQTSADGFRQRFESALSHGVYGFCLYYDWLNGWSNSDRPSQRILAPGGAETPFCICWRNERRIPTLEPGEDDPAKARHNWDEWPRRFINDVSSVLQDQRYIRVGNAPLLLVLRPSSIPQCRRVISQWREAFHSQAGLALHIAAVKDSGRFEPKSSGFDAVVQGLPRNHVIPDPLRRSEPGLGSDGAIEDRPESREFLLGEPSPDLPWYRSLTSSWETNSAPVPPVLNFRGYKHCLRALVIEALGRASAQEPLIFVNAPTEAAVVAGHNSKGHIHRSWLNASRSALCEGLRAYWKIKGFQLTRADALAELRYVTRAK